MEHLIWQLTFHQFSTWNSEFSSNMMHIFSDKGSYVIRLIALEFTWFQFWNQNWFVTYARYGTYSFITCSSESITGMSWTRWIQCTHWYCISLRSILILSFHLYLGLLSDHFRLSDQNFVCISCIPMNATCPTILFFVLVTLILCAGEYRWWKFIIQFSPAFWYFLSQTHSEFFPWSVRQGFTPMWSNSYNYSCIYFTFLNGSGRMKGFELNCNSHSPDLF